MQLKSIIKHGNTKIYTFNEIMLPETSMNYYHACLFAGQEVNRSCPFLVFGWWHHWSNYHHCIVHLFRKGIVDFYKKCKKSWLRTDSSKYVSYYASFFEKYSMNIPFKEWHCQRNFDKHALTIKNKWAFILDIVFKYSYLHEKNHFFYFIQFLPCECIIILNFAKKINIIATKYTFYFNYGWHFTWFKPSIVTIKTFQLWKHAINMSVFVLNFHLRMFINLKLKITCPSDI